MTIVSFDRPFLVYFFWANKMKGLVHLLGVSYEAKREFVCEKIFTQDSLNKTGTGISPGINKITPTTV